MQLVIDSGSERIKAGLFDEDRLLHVAAFARPEQVFDWINKQNIEAVLISSPDPAKSHEMTALLTGYPCKILDVADFKNLATDETISLLRPDTIANIYGGLYHAPSNDCIIVDLGATVRFDYASKRGIYLGGAVFPAFNGVFELLEKARFPELASQSPIALGKTRLEQSKSGCYFGLLGAIERIVAELRLSSEAPSGVMSFATGAATASPEIQKELQDFIDIVDPHLTLVGLNQILKEGKG